MSSPTVGCMRLADLMMFSISSIVWFRSFQLALPRLAITFAPSCGLMSVLGKSASGSNAGAASLSSSKGTFPFTFTDPAGFALAVFTVRVGTTCKISQLKNLKRMIEGCDLNEGNLMLYVYVENILVLSERHSFAPEHVHHITKSQNVIIKLEKIWLSLIISELWLEAIHFKTTTLDLCAVPWESLHRNECRKLV